MATSVPLWSQPLEIIGVTGEFGSGKTLFGLTIDPANTIVYDTEKSSGSYKSLGFTHVDVAVELQRKFTRGYQPIQAFEWWLAQVRQIPVGKYRVIMLDTASEIEAGLTDWVEANPEHFGHSHKQYEKMAGVKWGDVKEYWKLILTDIATRCETFVFVTHMTNVWDDNRPTGKRKPKGKETLMELASLYLHMERKADAKGNRPAKPSATVLKSRLATTTLNAQTGEIEIVPTLPPRLPVATPHAIREYMAKPPDPTKLKQAERLQEEKMSDDERLQLQMRTAEANAEAERLRADRELRQSSGRAKVLAEQAAETTNEQTGSVVVVKPEMTTLINDPPVDDQPASEGVVAINNITEEQLAELKVLRGHFFAAKALTDDEKKQAWAGVLEPYKVSSALDLTKEQADDLIKVLSVHIPF